MITACPAARNASWSHDRPARRPRPPRGITGRALACLALAALSAWPRPATAADPFLVIADSPDAETLPLPSIAAEFTSFEDVSKAVSDERSRIAALEARIRELEKAAKPATETLPPPTAREPGKPKDAGAAAGTSDKPGDKKSDKKDGTKPADEDYEVGSDLNMPTKWNYGLEGGSAHKDFRVKVGGRIQFDNTAFSQGDGPAQKPADGGLNQPLRDATNFRRTRVRVDGRMYEVYDFASEWDFSNQLNAGQIANPSEPVLGNYASITENWLQVRDLPVLGTVRGGNQKDPFGFEHLTSSRFLNFMERSYAQDLYEGPFNNGFIPGVRMLNNAYDQRLTWSAGVFKQNYNVFGYADTGRANSAVGRLTWLPVYEDEGKKLLHLGIAGRAQQTNFQDQVRLRARGDLRNGPPGPLNSIYIDSGLLTATWQNQLGVEFVGVNGPWSFQSEYFANWLYNTTSTSQAFDKLNPNYGTAGLQPKGAFCGTYFTNSGYAEVLYFITGESRAYDKIEARFDRVVPRNNFYVLRDGSGRMISSEGALQVGLRYQYACLSDHQINGGTLNALTAGLNWFFNPNAKLQFNYDFAYRDFTNNLNKNASGWITGFGTRLAFDF